MAIYKRGKIWWYEFQWQGKRFRESTKTNDRKVAREIEAAHKKSLADTETAIRLASYNILAPNPIDPLITPGLKEFIDRAIVPALVEQYLEEVKRKTCSGPRSQRGDAPGFE